MEVNSREVAMHPDHLVIQVGARCAPTSILEPILRGITATWTLGRRRRNTLHCARVPTKFFCFPQKKKMKKKGLKKSKMENVKNENVKKTQFYEMAKNAGRHAIRPHNH